MFKATMSCIARELPNEHVCAYCVANFTPEPETQRLIMCCDFILVAHLLWNEFLQCQHGHCVFPNRDQSEGNRRAVRGITK